jgi:hypothetical protein
MFLLDRSFLWDLAASETEWALMHQVMRFHHLREGVDVRSFPACSQQSAPRRAKRI